MDAKHLMDLALAQRARAEKERERKNDDLLEPLRRKISALEAELAEKPRKRGK